MSATAELRPAQAIALGLLHGPAELLPVSSSGHMTLLPWLLGWDCQALDPELQKSFEVALHAATAGALLIHLRREVREAIRDSTPHEAILIGLSLLPPAVAGYVLEHPIERHLSRPGVVAAGLVAGSLAMLAGDRRPASRSRTEATAADALWLGVAEACALMPGVSRTGATLAVARRRGFSREDADVLSRQLALPIIVAAAARRLSRRRALPAGLRVPLIAGMLAAFASALASSSIIARAEHSRSLLPYAGYRLGLAALVARRLRSERCSTIRS